MPIISASRPGDFDALAFALFLSLWQLVFSLPALLLEKRMTAAGKPAAPGAGLKARAVVVATGMIFGFSTYLYVLAVEKAGAISFAIAVQAYPLFAILWETMFLGRRKSVTELSCTGVLIATMYFLGTGGTWRIEGMTIWFLLALSVPFLWSVAHVILKEVLNKTPVTPNQVVFSRVLVSSLFLGVCLLVTAGPDTIIAAATDLRFQSAALLMGFVYYLELIVWFHAATYIDVSLASSVTVPAPLVTTFLALLLLGETAESYQLIALAIVVVSLLGLIAAGHRKAPA
ncbi:DMT family transporter [Reyranella sp.]|uniref:DMT family transporter n=1 Tax=Reyranella sp. TaxID=1929291 RepID=UPI0025E9FA03|nr:DMT family transporter [Reyranella sp.]